MRIVTITTFFPNSAYPYRTIFVRNLVGAMRQYCDLSVVAPVPYAPPLPRMPRWVQLRSIGGREDFGGIEVRHPRYVVLPRLDWLSGLSYFLAVRPVLSQLLRRHGPSLLHAHCAYPDGVGVAMAARALGVPYVITSHGSDINVYAKHAALAPQIRWALRGAAGLIAVSGALEARIVELTVGRTPPLRHIPCAGFDPAVFLPRPGSRDELGVPAAAKLVVFVGNLVAIKGVNILVEAWLALRQRGLLGDEDRLVVIGSGPCRADLEGRVAGAGAASSVRFAGAMAQAEVSRWIAAADTLCLPSYNEGMPNVVVEALASGTPVVASRVGGIPELVREGVNGLLVEPGDPQRLAGALQAALARPWDRGAIPRSVAHLTWNALAQENCEFLETVRGMPHLPARG